MSNNLQRLILETVEASRLPGKKKEELRKELFAHFFDEQKELQMQGYSEEKFFVKIKESFGNTQIISKELHMVHTSLSLGKLLNWFVIIFPLLWLLIIVSEIFLDQSTFTGCSFNRIDCWGFVPLVFIGSLVVTLFSLVIYPFSWVLISFYVITIFTLTKILPKLKNYFKDKNIKNDFLFFIYSVGSIFQWLSLFFSWRSVEYQNPRVDAVAQGGFLFKIFDYPMVTMGENMDAKMFHGIPYFYLNYIIWMCLATILYYVLPEKIKKNQKVLSILLVVAITLSLYGCSYILMKFDD